MSYHRQRYFVVLPIRSHWKILPKFMLLLISSLCRTSSAFIIQSSLSTALKITLTSYNRDSTNLHFRDSDGDDGSDFKTRMRNIVKQQKISSRKTSSLLPKNVKSAESLQEFADVIEEGRRSKQMVVVQFHATWCKKCHYLRPLFYRMASSNPQTIFLEVPVTEKNANLHQGLNVQTVPYSHVYHPEKGLVAETKLSRETFSEFVSFVERHNS